MCKFYIKYQCNPIFSQHNSLKSVIQRYNLNLNLQVKLYYNIATNQEVRHN